MSHFRNIVQGMGQAMVLSSEGKYRSADKDGFAHDIKRLRQDASHVTKAFSKNIEANSYRVKAKNR